MEEIIPILREGLTRLGLPDADKAAEMLGVYARRLTEYNEKVNLTAITDPTEIATKPCLDCAACAPYIPQGSRCADVGTGAGFPGMVLAIVRPDLELVLFDSLQKRLNFLEELAQELGVRVRCVHSRAEDAGQSPLYREKFDIALSRAVARMSVLAELTLPLVKTGGTLIALKGPEAEKELKEARGALRILGAGASAVEPSEAFDGQQHSFVLVRKQKPTPKGYPRKAGTPARQPLK